MAIQTTVDGGRIHIIPLAERLVLRGNKSQQYHKKEALIATNTKTEANESVSWKTYIQGWMKEITRPRIKTQEKKVH